MGLGAFPASDRAVPRHARHARHVRSEQRDARRRSDPRDRRTLRRPRDQQSEEVLPAGDDRSHRRRPGVDLEDHPRGHSDRRSGRCAVLERNGADARAGTGEARPARQRGIAEWWKQIDAWRSAHGLEPRHARRAPIPTTSILPQQAVQALLKATNGNAYVTSDVGQHQMFAAQYYKFDEPRRWINSGGLGTMGFGLPAAMGVQFAFPHATVACVTGEGSFMMNMQELSTCLQYGLPIKIVNLNNAALGMVKQWQDMQYGGRHSHSTYREALPEFREARRIVRPRRHAHRPGRRPDAGDDGGVQRQEPRSAWYSSTFTSIRKNTSTRWRSRAARCATCSCRGRRRH